MQEYELKEGEFYLISTFEDTDRGYSVPRAAKLLRLNDGSNFNTYVYDFSYNRQTVSSQRTTTYLVEDTDGATSWLTIRDFVGHLDTDYIERMQTFWGCQKEKDDAHSD